MDCRACGLVLDVSCKCGAARWNTRVRLAMLDAHEAHQALEGSIGEHPLVRLRLRDALEKKQGRVVDLQWVYLESIGAAKPRSSASAMIIAERINMRPQ